MAKVTEVTSSSQMQDSLNEGLKSISASQKVTFYKYTRAVLPLDGYVFWVRDVSTPAIEVQGSLHYDTDQQQRVDETIGLNHVVFTTQEEIQSFNSVASDITYIGQIDEIRFAFTSRGKKFQNAGTYHYRGDAIYPAMYTQIIDNPSNPVNLGNLIATNSMPIWLALNTYMTMFPAFLAESNFPPPYAAIDINETKAFQSAPLIDNQSNSTQLMTEKVRIVMTGLRNNQAIDFLRYIIDYSLSSDAIGIQNMPAIVDEKRGQSELGILAQKKIIEFEVNYYQNRVLDIARQLITSANITVTTGP